MTSYNGQTITYDSIGNPLNYRDGITLTWQNVRELATYSDDNYDVTYTYDASSMRTGKSVTASSGTTTNYSYVYENGLLQKMTRGNRILEFSYDANGTPISIKYRSNATATPAYYYYGTNSRGDIVALYNSNGTVAAKYEYDAYGKLLSVKTSAGINITGSTSIANLNPLRYRGYVYDNETGFYYLQSRYYDPTTCRFINGDSQLNIDSFNGYNTFAYCSNNPIMNYDPNGTKEFECCPHGDCSKCRKSNQSFWGSIFGAGSSTTSHISHEVTPILPDASPISITMGSISTKTIKSRGDSSKPISVYANKDASHPIKSSSAGLNINIVKFCLSVNLSLDNIGIYGSWNEDNSSSSFGIRANLWQMKLGFEGSTSYYDGDLTQTEYTNASISGWALVALYHLCTTGQFVLSPNYAYQ